MSESGDELTPLPEQPEDTRSRFTRSPYLVLGVAAVVVSTAFATVAALTGARDDEPPAPESRGAIESTTFDTYPVDPTTTSSRGGRPSSSPGSTPSGTTTTTTSGEIEEGTTTDGATGVRGGSEASPNAPRSPVRPTTPRPTGNPPTTTPPNEPPVAVLGGGCPATGFECSFTGSGSSDPENGDLRYFWDFGDGATSTAVNPSHTFAAGTYQVTLTVTDNKGQSATASTTVTVAAAATTSSN
jgi:hypothetical protein